MAETAQSRGPMRESAWAPLLVKAFRALWLAQVGSAIGTWMQTVGAQWLLIEEPGAETLVAMVQVAAGTCRMGPVAVGRSDGGDGAVRPTRQCTWRCSTT